MVLVDAVERYPTMFDFSSVPSLTTAPAVQVVGEVKRTDRPTGDWKSRSVRTRASIKLPHLLLKPR